MSTYTATVTWQLGPQEDVEAFENFAKGRYSRRHLWRFDGGQQVAASSSPHVVPLPWSDAQAVDPEEAFVASLASCHMLWFLSIAARQGFAVQHYEDRASGVMEKNAQGKLWVSVITLAPAVRFTGRQPSFAELQALHHAAHEECFIAQSVKTEVRCQPVWPLPVGDAPQPD